MMIKLFDRLKIGSFLNKLLLYLLIVYTFFMLGRSIWQNYQLKKQIEGIQREISQIKQRNQDLNNLIIYYQSPGFREVEARQKLGLKKPGEKVVMVAVKDTGNYQTEQEQEQENITATSKKNVIEANWQLWWRYFTK